MAAQNSTSNDHLNSALSKLTPLVDNHFECGICLDSYSDPHVIPECLHRFCGACVKESIRKCGAKCPKCRARITTKRGLRKDKKLQEMVSEKWSGGCCLRLLISSTTTTSSEVLINYYFVFYWHWISSSIRWTKLTAQSNHWNAYTFCKWT